MKYLNITIYILEAAEIRFLRSKAGYTLLDKKRSSDIREKLGIFIINDKSTQYKINWRELMQRMDDNRLLKKNLNYKPEGRRNIRRMNSGMKEQAKGPKPYS